MEDVNRRIEDVKWSLEKRMEDVNKGIDHLYTGINVWFALLTLLIVVFKLLKV